MRRARTELLLTLTTSLLLCAGAAFSLECTKKTTTTAYTVVYESPPRYVTGSGWQGTQTDQLAKGTTVYICREQNLAFGFTTRTWVQVQYRLGDSREWKNGWIPSETLTMRRDSDSHGLFAMLIVPANAEESPPQTAASTSTEELPPPLPPAASTGPSSLDSATAISWWDLCTLYGPLFLALVLGILAKVGVDCLDDWNNLTVRNHMLRGHVRNGLIALLVSPIVFLSFLSTGQFPAAKQTFLILALLAFQNGFFWQTVLKKGEKTV